MSISTSAVRYSVIRRRRGVTAVESAITLPVLFVVLFAFLDLGLVATRYNALAEVSRRIAREAALHGSLRAETSTGWGPQPFVGTLADESELVAAAWGCVPTVQDADVTVRITWPDNSNTPRDRVHVEVGYRHEPLIPLICPWGPLDLRAKATMRIVN